VDFEFSLAKAASWAPAGHVVAAAQIAIPGIKPRKVMRAATNLPPVERRSNPETVEFSAGDVEATFDRSTGSLARLRRSGRDIVVGGPRLQLWRAATDNDGIRCWEGQERKILGKWRDLGLDGELLFRGGRIKVSTSSPDGSVTAFLSHQITTSRRRNWRDVLHRHRYTMFPEGRIVVWNEIRICDAFADLPRVGVRIDLAEGFERLAYFGCGPFESYCDRRSAAHLGVWENRVADEYVDYVMPQEHGHHTDARWIELATESRDPLRFRVEADPVIEFNSSHFSAEDLYAARHTSDLSPRKETLLYLDAAHRGLGTATCGPDVLAPYRVPSGRHLLSFTVTV
jgi:beta-galactosidase